MNRRIIWRIIPAVLLPYFMLFGLAIIFFSPESAAMGFIMDNVFRGNAWNVGLIILLFYVLALGLCIAWLVISLRKDYSAVWLAKIAMIVKTIHIPAFVANFFLGIVFAITIFTLPFTVILIIFDCMMILLTGILSCTAVIAARRQQLITSNQKICFLIMQFFFCADVVSTILLFRKLGKQA